MSLQSFRERINVWLYDSKERVLGAFQWLTLLVNLAALSVLAVYYGYHHDTETAEQLFDVVFSFAFYVLHYGVRVLYFHPRRFRETWAEGLVMLLLLVEGAGDVLLGSPPLGQDLATLMPSIGDFSTFWFGIFVCCRPDGMDAAWISAASRPLASCSHLHPEFCPAHRGGHLVVEHA